MADLLSRAADAALDVSLQLYSTRWSRPANAEALQVIEETLVEVFSVSRVIAGRALLEAVMRRGKGRAA